MNDVRVLGVVGVPDAQMPLGGRRARRLLARLLVTRGQTISVEALRDDVWGDDRGPVQTSKGVVKSAVNRLRTSLSHVPADELLLETTGSGYRLTAATGVVDADLLSAAVSGRGTVRSHGDRLRQLEAALRSWRGIPYSGIGDAAWAESEVNRLSALYLEVEEEWVEAQMLAGTFVDPQELQAAARREPYRERRWEQLIVALYRAGRQADALDAFDEARRLLAEDLGLQPGPTLRGLQGAVLRQDPDLMRLPTTGSAVHARPPVPLTSLLGRERAIETIADLLTRNRLVTLTGLGGVGKSRIATEVAARVAPTTSIVVELERLASPADVVPAVAAVLGVSGYDSEPEALAALLARLLDQPLLLLLDGAERSSRAVHDLLHQLLPRAGQVRALITSRQPIGLDGEVTHRVEPLPLGTALEPGPGLQLLLDRLGRGVGDDEWPALSEIARATGGIPLAVEVLAAEADGRPIVELADHVRGLLVGGEDSAVTRSVGFALDRLTRDEEDLLCAAALLAGGLGDGAAAAMTGLVEPGRTRAALVRSGLASVRSTAGGARMHVLEPVRLAVEARLEPGRAASFVEAAVAHHTELVLQVGGGFRIPDLARLPAVESELDNIRSLLEASLGSPSGLRLAVGLSTVMRESGRAPEGVRWIDRHLVAAERVDADLRAEALLNAVSMPGYFANFSTSEPRLHEAEELARASGSDRLLLIALLFRAVALGWRGCVDDAVALVRGQECQDLLREVDDPWLALHERRLLALARALTGDARGGSADLQGLAVELLDLNDPSGAVSCWFVAAHLARSVGDLDAASEALRRARLLVSTGGARSTQALVAHELAQLARLRREPGAARRLELAVDELERVGNLRTASAGRRDLGIWLLEDGDAHSGLDQLARSLPVLLVVDAQASAIALVEVAAAAARRGRETAAALLAGAAQSVIARGGGAPATPTETDRIVTLLQRYRGLSDFDTGRGLDDEDVMRVCAEVVGFDLVEPPSRYRGATAPA